MSARGRVSRLDERGRLVLPAALRRHLGVGPGDELTVTEEADGSLRVQSRHAAARALIGLAGQGEQSMVEELRTQRRRDAAGDDTDVRRQSR